MLSILNLWLMRPTQWFADIFTDRRLLQLVSDTDNKRLLLVFQTLCWNWYQLDEKQLTIIHFFKILSVWKHIQVNRWQQLAFWACSIRVQALVRFFLELLHILILYILAWGLNNPKNQKGPVGKNKPLCMINNMAFQ